jgi:hypothetical protein
MKYKRLFTFGCSLTNYSPPTWADIVSWDLNIPTQNWGQAGIGNVGIFHKMVECDIRNQFTEDDLILVLWSSWTREDRYKEYAWLAGGTIFNNPYYDEDFIKKYWSFSNDIIKNSTAIISANKMFKIQFQGSMSSAYDTDTNSLTKLKVTEREMDIYNLYKLYVPKTNIFKPPVLTEYCKLVDDSHPDLLEHLKYAKEVVYKTLGFTIKEETEKLCYNLHDEFMKTLKDNIHLSTPEKRKLINDMVLSKNLDSKDFPRL